MAEQTKNEHNFTVPAPSDIKLFLTDVDGTLTDGGMYYGSDGTEFKKFNTRDGMGLQLLQRTGVKVGIVTSENTPINVNRARKLGVDFLKQSARDGGKLAATQEICDALGTTLTATTCSRQWGGRLALPMRVTK